MRSYHSLRPISPLRAGVVSPLHFAASRYIAPRVRAHRPAGKTFFMKIKTTLAALVLFLVLLGCSKNPAENVPAAGVSAATNTPAAVAPTAATDAARPFAFGPTDSSIGFTGSKVTGSHNGGFKTFAGEFKVMNGRLADAGNKVVINTTSLWSDADRLTGHLKSPDFFDVAKFPTATFVTLKVEPKATNHLITGNLTLHGVTKQISFPAKIEVTDTTVTVAAEFFVNRADFEMKYPGKADDLIRQEVVLKLKVKATPGAADFPAVEKPAPSAQGRTARTNQG